jgi:uncharacterized repeat protein (TIGR01451 family)
VSGTGNNYSISTTQSTVSVTGTVNSVEYYYTNSTGQRVAGACVSGTALGTGSTRNVNPALPRTPGSYTIFFQAFSSNDCSGTGGSAFNGGAVMVTQVAPNPAIKLQCNPLKVLLVLDESASINSLNAITEVRDAAKGFVDSLHGTGAELGITAFSITARPGYPTTGSGPSLRPAYAEVTDQSINGFKNWIDNGSGTNGYNPAAGSSRNGTNWQDALRSTGTNPTVTGSPNLVVFVTDGDPNTINQPDGTGQAGLNTSLDGSWTVMGPAQVAANTLKTAASRIFAIGVGPLVNNPASQSRLTAVSGPEEFRPGGDFTRSSWTSVSFTELKPALGGIVAKLCGSSLTITKYEWAATATAWEEASGWDFTTELNTTQPHIWLTPRVSGDFATQTTNDEGVAEFHWRLENPGTSNVSVIRERSKRGWRFVFAKCRIFNEHGELVDTLRSTTTIPGLSLAIRDYANCSVYNRQKVAHLTVIKNLKPEGDPGRFNLLVDGAVRAGPVGNNGSTGRLVLTTGSYRVSESAAGTTNLAHYTTTTACFRSGTTNTFPTTDVVPPPPGEAGAVSVTLRDGDDVTCYITNRNTQFGNLTVVKHLVPEGSGEFNLFIHRADGSVVNGVGPVGDGGTVAGTNLPFPGPYVVGETAANGTDLSAFDITITCEDDTGGFVAGGVTGPSTLEVTLNRPNVLCTIVNAKRHIPLAHLEVRKRLRPTNDPGLFDLRINGVSYTPEGAGDGGTTTSLPFSPGKYKVSESLIQTEGHAISLSDYSISTKCVDASGHTVASGTGRKPVSVSLSDGDNVVCTITNKRVVEPDIPEEGDQGGGEVPLPPCNDIDSGTPECPDLTGTPQLFVVKRMPATARVGDRLPITITVKNVGRTTAVEVTVHETPPPGGKIVGVANHGLLQSDGTVVWNLGALAPGETRTVHATMLITGTGLSTDTAVASAGNADPAFDVAAVRVRARVHAPPPPVTG